jgi:8-oxo-dGTP diphosphatase
VTRVAAGVAVRAGRALVCRRPPGRAHAGKWEFPGGKLEPEESWEQALERELREELGIRAVVGAELWRVEHHTPAPEPLEIRFFAIAEMRGALCGGHFAEVRWHPLERLCELDFLEADRDLVVGLATGLILPPHETTGERPGVNRGPAARASTSARSPGARRDR